MAKKVKKQKAASVSARAQKRLSVLKGKANPFENATDARGTLSKFVKLFKPHRWKLLIIALASAGTTLFTIFGPENLGKIITEIQHQIENKLAGATVDFSDVYKIIIMLIIIYTISCVATFVQQFTMAGITQKMIYKLRKDVNAKISRLPLSYFDRSSKGELLSRITNDIDNVSKMLQNAITQVIIAVVTILGVLIMILKTDLTLSVICIITLPLCAFVAAFVAKRSQHYYSKQWEKTGEMNGHIEEIYTAHNLVKAFNREQDSIREFDEINEELLKSSRSAQYITGLIWPLSDIINNLGFVFICLIGALFTISGKIGIGAITAFITYSKLITHPVTTFSNVMNQLQSGVASAERIFSLLEEEEIDNRPPTQSFTESIRGRVEFKDVCFSYSPDKPLIEHMNLTIEPGQTVAIVGPTGAGKTTIVNLLMRFYELDSGQILIDGKDISELSREELRNTLGMVLQDTWLFNGTIKENIGYGKIGSDTADIVEAAKSARAHRFIKTLSEGYNTVLEEEGSNVSQGQRQLLTIARAILADPKILILDEATSSVDTRTEVLIQKAMISIMDGRTSFVIAHRLSTIRDADVIMVMNKGNFVESGSHEELMKKKGFYYDLYRSQFMN